MKTHIINRDEYELRTLLLQFLNIELHSRNQTKKNQNKNK